MTQSQKQNIESENQFVKGHIQYDFIYIKFKICIFSWIIVLTVKVE